MGQLKLYTTDLGQVDLYRVENNLQPAKDKNDTGQKVLLRSSTNKGEYPYNFSYGLDFVGSILAQKPVPSKSTIAALINESLLSIEGVLKVNPLDFTFNEDGYILNISYSLETADGTIEGQVL